jgi:hypothetical protein
MQQTFSNTTAQQAIAFLNQIEGKLDDAATIAQLQAVNAELINFSSTAGFVHLPIEILQRWDALHDQVAEIEESALSELADQAGVERSAVDLNAEFDQRRSLSEAELGELAKEYVERLDHARALEHRARFFTSTALTAEDIAFEHYENAFEQGASEEDWNAAVQSARVELQQRHIEEVASIAVRVLNSVDSDEVQWDGKVFTFICDKNRLLIMDDDENCVIHATWTGENWKHQASNLSRAELLTFKREIEVHLNERAYGAEQQPEPQEIQELG